MAVAAEVDTWGFTFVASRKGDEPWKQFQAVDLVRGGRAGKPFWHAEAEAGPLWMQPQVIDRPREDGRIPDENGRAALEPGLVRGRRHRHPVSAMAASARRPAVRRFRSVRHGWVRNAARGDGGQGSRAGPMPIRRSGNLSR